MGSLQLGIKVLGSLSRDGKDQNPPSPPSEEQITNAIKNTKATRPTALELATTEKFLNSSMDKKELTKLCKEIGTVTITDKFKLIHNYDSTKVPTPNPESFIIKQAVLFNGHTGENFVLMLSENPDAKNNNKKTKYVSISRNLPFKTAENVAVAEGKQQKATPEQQGKLSEFIRCNHKFENGKELPKNFSESLSFKLSTEKIPGTAKLEKIKDRDDKGKLVEIPDTEKLCDKIDVLFSKDGKFIELGYIKVEAKDSRLISLNNDKLKSIELNAQNINKLCVRAEVKMPPKP